MTPRTHRLGLCYCVYGCKGVCLAAGSTLSSWRLWRARCGVSGRAASDQRITERTRWERMPPLATRPWCCSTKVRGRSSYTVITISCSCWCAAYLLSHRPSPRAGGSSSRHGGWTSHPQPTQTVILWGRPAHHDHPPLLPPHQALHGRTHANQWGRPHKYHRLYLHLPTRSPTETSLSQRQRLIRTSKNQRDGEAGPGSRCGSTSNSLKRTGSCSLENGGGRPGMGDAELGDKPGVEACQPEEEDDDEDGSFSPVRIPG